MVCKAGNLLLIISRQFSFVFNAKMDTFRFHRKILTATNIHRHVWGKWNYRRVRLYQSRCPECCLRVGPTQEREFWTAADIAETNNPAGGSRRWNGEKTQDRISKNEGKGRRAGGRNRETK